MIIIENADTKDGLRLQKIEHLESDWPFREQDKKDRTITCAYCGCIFEVTPEDVINIERPWTGLAYEHDFYSNSRVPWVLIARCPNDVDSSHLGKDSMRVYRPSYNRLFAMLLQRTFR